MGRSREPPQQPGAWAGPSGRGLKRGPLLRCRLLTSAPRKPEGGLIRRVSWTAAGRLVGRWCCWQSRLCRAPMGPRKGCRSDPHREESCADSGQSAPWLPLAEGQSLGWRGLDPAPRPSRVLCSVRPAGQPPGNAGNAAVGGLPPPLLRWHPASQAPSWVSSGEAASGPSGPWQNSGPVAADLTSAIPGCCPRRPLGAPFPSLLPSPLQQRARPVAESFSCTEAPTCWPGG